MPTGLSEAASQILQGLVAAHADLTTAGVEELAAMAAERRFTKGATLLAAGEEALIAGVVVDGVLGEFYVGDDGMRKAKWLASAGDVVGSMEDLVRKGPARATIQALSASTVLCLPYARLRALAMENPTWSRFFISMLEQLYRRKSEREYTLLMLSAEERYRWFLGNHAAVEANLSQEIIASYLGITPVHLSRIRRSIAES